MGRETLNKTEAPPPFVLCAQNISNKLCRQKFPLLGFGKNWMRSVEANWRIPNFQKVLAVGQLVQVSLVYDVWCILENADHQKCLWQIQAKFSADYEGVTNVGYASPGCSPKTGRFHHGYARTVVLSDYQFKQESWNRNLACVNSGADPGFWLGGWAQNLLKIASKLHDFAKKLSPRGSARATNGVHVEMQSLICFHI